MTYIIKPSTGGSTGIYTSDSPSIDAFGRWRTSTPTGIFDSQFTYNLRTLLYEQVTAGTGATIAHDATNRCALMTFSSTPTGGKAFMQSFEYIPYQPGKSQLVFCTFNFIETAANTLKFIGISDGSNGIEFQLNGSTKQFTIYSDTDVGDQTVTQANWNLDKFDGTGPSALTLDITKVQIAVIDYQALYVGRVRVGFDIGGLVYYVHEFRHANTVTCPYLQYASLPIRCGMTCTGTSSTTVRFVCASVSSEGGQEDTGGALFSVEGTATAANGSQTHVLSIRPTATSNSIVNRAKIILDGIDVVVTGSNTVKWEMCLGQAISGTTTYTAVNSTYSGVEYNTAGTISGSPALVLFSGYCVGGAAVKTSVSAKILSKYPITLDAAGTARALGTLTLVATAYTGTSAMRASFNWKEIR